jgi:hypothetical protein
MQLLDGQWYLLPDGERVQAIESSSHPGSWRLDTPLGPAYLFSDGAWKALHYDAAEDAYAVIPCDLTTDDLRPA